MKLVRFGASGEERPGLVDKDGAIRDLSAHISDIDGAALSGENFAKIKALDVSSLSVVSGSPRIGPCVGNVSKIVGIGLNYSDHAEEAGMPAPAEPIIFMKSATTICGPNDDVIKPPHSTKLDYEVELGIVIGRRASYVSEDDALAHVAGYCVVNDISEREFQIERPGAQWDKGKNCDTFAPLGPWMVTSDEVGNPQNLTLNLSVNGEARQIGSTSNMIFGVKELVSHVSQYVTLLPGDVITTGTPPGVGMGMKPPTFLNAGDTIKLSISGLGEQNQTVSDYS